MCGIVGYVGNRDAVPILMAGLKKLEYRGYDSAGIAIYNSKGLELRREVGNLQALEKSLAHNMPEGTWGLGHTRWATHGRPSLDNAHPHTDCHNKLVVVHNGIIENFQELKEELLAQGHTFRSQTDTEVIAHLVESCYDGDLSRAVSEAVDRLQGSFALAVMATNNTMEIVAVRQDSPLILGLGAGENFLASDIPALLPHTKRMVILEDGEKVQITSEHIRILDAQGNTVERTPQIIDWGVELTEKAGYPHFMLKEIYEQPAALRRLLAGRLGQQSVALEGFQWEEADIKALQHIYIVACGTAYHSGLVAKSLMEKITGVSVEVDLASEFRYRDPLLKEGTLVIVVSQSGETADTLAALRHARQKGARILALVNAPESSIAREAGEVLYLKAGPEIAVASTKAYFNMLGAFLLLNLYWASVLKQEETVETISKALLVLPLEVERVLDDLGEGCRRGAQYLKDWKSTFFVGRGHDFALAQEGALKLKEISYIHAEAYAAGELKHGTLALIEEGSPVVALLTEEKVLEKTLSNVQEIRARGGYILGVSTENLKDRVQKEVDILLTIPTVSNVVAPLLAIVPLQLLAYETAELLDCPIDQPRNLAKSVTVE